MRIFKPLLTATIILFTVFCLQSCNTDDGSNNNEPDTYMRFSIDGKAYEFKNIITAESNSITLNGNNGASITDAGDTRLTIWLPKGVEKGTFNIENGFDAKYQVSFTSEPLGFDFDFANSGTITITAVSSDYIEGTFTTKVVKDNTTVNLTNGSFKGLGI